MSNAGDSMRGMGISSIITAFSSFFADAVSTIRIVNRIISLDSISGGGGDGKHSATSMLSCMYSSVGGGVEGYKEVKNARGTHLNKILSPVSFL